MLKNVKAIERYVSQGLVLDVQGQWRPIDEVVAEEIEYLRHLEKGEILENGRWVNLDDILAKQSPLQAADAADLPKPEKVKEDEQHEIAEDELVEDTVEVLPPVEEPIVEAQITDEKAEVDIQEKVEIDAQEQAIEKPDLLDTVAVEIATASLETERDTVETVPEEIERAESDDSETRRFELDTAQIEITKTQLLETESAGVSEPEIADTDDELLSTDEFESVISEMENSEMEKAEDDEYEAEESEEQFNGVDDVEPSPSSAPPLPPETPRQSPSEPVESFSSETPDEWGMARSRNVKILIGSIAGGVVIILFIVLKIFLW